MPVRHDLVLVGGGHAHVQVLRRLAMDPPPGVALTVVLDTPVAVYSGMVPGFVAGQYTRDELEIDVRPLAMRAGARFVVSAATGVDPSARRIELAGRPSLPYDVASFDVGSTIAGSSLPGVAEHALPTRPIGAFVRRVDALVERARGRDRFRIVVVGAGAGGVELAFAFRARLAAEGVRGVEVTLLEAAERVLPDASERMARRVAGAAEARGITVRTGERVASVEAGCVRLESGDSLECDATVWVVGAASLPLFPDNRFENEAGFVRVRRTLQVVGHDDLFAVGDCVRFEPDLPKAGVYAVRQGPVLTRNLRACIEGRPLDDYRPQTDFLSLLNLGDGSAIGGKYRRAVEGRAVFALKDWIDRRFVRRFQVLGADGERSSEFPEMPGMGPDEMPCGGCAAKVGVSTLERALSRLEVPQDDAVVLGLAAPDDAAAVTTPGGEIVVASVDAFRAFTDDPWLVGRVSAVNAASDLFAKGVPPRFALAQVNVPESDPARDEETLFQVLAGARAFLDGAGVTLVGGHTTSGETLAVGFSIWGSVASADSLLRVSGLAPGDRLLLTKPLGTGVLFHADMRGLARGEWMEAAVASMLRDNGAAADVAVGCRATASTDVSGFGLAGHLGEMLRSSKVAARLELEAVPLLPGARELLSRGLRSTFHPENARARRALGIGPRAAANPALDVLFDPQTSGGLLFGVPAERAREALDRLHAAGDVDAAEIGTVVAAQPGGALFEVE